MCKRVFLAILLSLSIASSGFAANEKKRINRPVTPGTAELEAPTAAAANFHCHLEDIYTNVVDVVRVSNPWSGDIKGYWVYFGYNGTWTKAVVAININSQVPLDKITQTVFTRGGSTSGDAVLPFAIPDWGGVTKYGTGNVTVKFFNGNTVLGSTSCSFTISP